MKQHVEKREKPLFKKKKKQFLKQMLKHCSHFTKKQFMFLKWETQWLHSQSWQQWRINKLSWQGWGLEKIPVLKCASTVSLYSSLLSCQRLELCLFGIRGEGFLCLPQRNLQVLTIISFFLVRFFSLPQYDLGKARALAGLNRCFDFYVTSSGREKTWP